MSSESSKQYGLHTVDAQGNKSIEVTVCESVAQATVVAAQSHTGLIWREVGDEVHGYLNGQLCYTIEPGTLIHVVVKRRFLLVIPWDGWRNLFDPDNR